MCPCPRPRPLFLKVTQVILAESSAQVISQSKVSSCTVKESGILSLMFDMTTLRQALLQTRWASLEFLDLRDLPDHPGLLEHLDYQVRGPNGTIFNVKCE